MPHVDMKKKQINCKIVYYGTGMGGKTTNLEYVTHRMKRDFPDLAQQTGKVWLSLELRMDILTAGEAWWGAEGRSFRGHRKACTEPEIVALVCARGPQR